MATSTTVQIICKITEIPPDEVVDGRNQFDLIEGDLTVTVQVKPKQYKKLLNHGYEHWVAAIAGGFGGFTAKGIELLNPSIQIFEKKPKPPKEEPAAAPAPPQN